MRRRHTVIIARIERKLRAAVVVHQRLGTLSRISPPDDIVEIEVEARGAAAPQRLEHRAILVIARGSEAEFGFLFVVVFFSQLHLSCRRRWPRRDSPDPGGMARQAIRRAGTRTETTHGSTAFGSLTSSSQTIGGSGRRCRRRWQMLIGSTFEHLCSDVGGAPQRNLPAGI